MAIKLPPAMKDNAKCFIVRVGEGHHSRQPKAINK
jgi:hypothetical protein